MKKRLIFILLIFFILSPFFAQKNKVSDLPALYKKWLEEEVVYIITSGERDVFLQLKTDRERGLFIQAFWKHKDPSPGTPENEFKKEHFSRISYSNRNFGRATPKAGWKTDRGRMYIILGPPGDIQRVEGKSQVYPTRIWFYRGKTELGLPPGFNLVFYQENFIGEFRLYSPLKDGPQALLTSYYGDPNDYVSAYNQLREFSSELAEVCLSLIPGESSRSVGRPSVASDLLIQKVETIPERRFDDKYAKKFLQFKDIVEVEYSTNYIDCYSLVAVLKEPSGVYFVHYVIEPKRLSVNEFDNKYTTSLKVNGVVKDAEDRTVFQYEKTIPLEIGADKIRALSQKPFNIHDMFPLIPGNYKFSVLVRNEASREFTSFERDLIIPQDRTSLQMVSFFLGYRAVRLEEDEQKGKLKPFRVGSYQVYLQPNRVFLTKDKLIAVFQLHGINPDLRKKGQIQYQFFRMDEKFRSTTKKVSEYLEIPNIIEEFSLKDFPPDIYRLRISLMVEGREILFDSKEFEITYRTDMVRPWIYAKILPEVNDPIYSHLIGTQLFNSGKVEEAQANLEKSFKSKPDSIDFALNLARLYMIKKDYEKAKFTLFPFLSRPKPSFELLFLIGRVYQNSGEFDKAIDIFNKALSHFGLSTYILNAIGSCYFQLGNVEEAKMAWKKSFEIDPNQPQIKKNIETLKRKK